MATGTIKFGNTPNPATGAWNGEPETLDGDLQYPSGDYFYRSLTPTLGKMMHPMIELDEGETLARIVADGGISTYVGQADFHQIAGTNKYVATTLRDGTLSFSELSVRVRDVKVVFSVRTRTADSGPSTPAESTRTTLENRVGRILQRDHYRSEITDEDITAGIEEAVRDTYSQDRPRTIVTDVTGTGRDIPISDLTGYVEGFSSIGSIEYPIDDISLSFPAYIDDGDWIFYRAPDGLKIRMLSAYPSAGEQVRFEYTTPHTFSDMGNLDDVPDTDLDAIANLAASVCLDMLATQVASETDATITADTFDRQRRDRAYREAAKRYRERYRESIGKPAESGQVAANAVVDWDTRDSRGQEFLTHPSRWR